MSAHNALVAKLNEISAKVDKIKQMAAPPGLEQMSGDYACKMEAQLDHHFAQLQQTMQQGFHNLTFVISALAKQQLIPPSADTTDRIDRLETLLLCNPRFGPEVDTVLSALLAKESHGEPDRELSPVKECIEQDIASPPPSPMPGPKLNFDDYSEAGEKSAEVNHSCLAFDFAQVSDLRTCVDPGADEIDPLQKARQIAKAVRQEAAQIQQEQKFDEYSDFIEEQFGCLIASIPKRPHTKLSREAFEKKYGDIHRHFVWKSMCRKHFNETGDPLAKPDLILDIAAVIHSLWQQD